MAVYNRFKQEIQKLTHSPVYLAIFLTCVIIITGLLLITQIFHFTREGFLTPQRNTKHRTHSTFIGPITIEQIQPWMTFEYINHIFQVPSDYLKKVLNISDSRYPRISLGSFARRNYQSDDEILTLVRQAITTYKPNGGIY